MFYFANPWGLIALVSLGAVVFLYFFVFRGRRIEVSSLHLWQAARSLRFEGQQKKRPPLTLPLVLELLSALLLSLLVAQAMLSREVSLRHLVIILDGSASMNARGPGGPWHERVAQQVDRYFGELGGDGRVTLIESAFEPRIVGKEHLSRDEAAAEVARWRPSGPAHPIGSAIELARAMAQEGTVPILITDRVVNMEGLQVVAVGEPLDNTGWVASHWMGSGELFALVEHFGPGHPRKTVSVYGDGHELARVEVDFAERRAVPLSWTVPVGVSSVRLELPDDALANDNTLLTARPVHTPVPVRVELEEEALARPVRRAVGAVREAVLSHSDSPSLVFCQEGAGQTAPFRVEFHRVAEAAAYAGPFTANGFHPLTRGIDLQGAIWAADAEFRAGEAVTLMAAGDVPLAVLRGNTLLLNLAPEGHNVFALPAWPVLVANVIEYVHERSPGLRRLSYRLGETLSFYKPAAWQGNVEVEAPDGTRVAFKGDRVYYGRLEREGVYHVLSEGRQVAAFDVNLLCEEESDLTGATSAGQEVAARPTEVRERAGRPFHREFALAALAMLLGCWYLLERRAP